jgi:hypothetical protein
MDLADLDARALYLQVNSIERSTSKPMEQEPKITSIFAIYTPCRWTPHQLLCHAISRTPLSLLPILSLTKTALTLHSPRVEKSTRRPCTSEASSAPRSPAVIHECRGLYRFVRWPIDGCPAILCVLRLSPHGSWFRRMITVCLTGGRSSNGHQFVSRTPGHSIVCLTTKAILSTVVPMSSSPRRMSPI